MAYIGPWGCYYHIPKCGGIAIRNYLWSRYNDRGRLVGGTPHSLPNGEEKAWTVVRHPAKWLLSYFTYIEQNNWLWKDRPEEIDDLFRFADGMFWPFYVKAICEQATGAIGKVFDMYCVEGVRWHKLEEIDKVFGEHVPVVHVTDNKAVMTDEHWQMICEAEKDTLEKYGYTDNRG